MEKLVQKVCLVIAAISSCLALYANFKYFRLKEETKEILEKKETATVVFENCSDFTALKEDLIKIKSHEVKEYTRKNLENIIAEQEKEIGLDFFGKVPVIVFGLPDEIEKNKYVGLYVPTEDIIYLAEEKLFPRQWIKAEIIKLFDEEINDLKGSLHHELAHFYCDQLSEKFGKGNWPLHPPFDPSNTSEQEAYEYFKENARVKLISEGIAVYVERRMTNKRNEIIISKDKWPKKYEDIKENLIFFFYEIGYQAVRPLIDQFDQKAIKHLMFNPPTYEELFALPAYQERMKQELLGN